MSCVKVYFKAYINVEVNNIYLIKVRKGRDIEEKIINFNSNLKNDAFEIELN